MHAPSPRCVRLSVVLKRIKAESGFCRCPEVLFAACELGVFDLLAEAPEALGSAAVAARLGVSSRGTELLLDACVSLKLLQVEVRREKGKHPGYFEGGILKVHPQHIFFFSVKGQRVSTLSLVGWPRGLCSCHPSLPLAHPSSWRQTNGRARVPIKLY